MTGGMTTKTGGRWLRPYAMPLLVLAVVVVYGRVCGFEFLDYDDNLNVYENPLLSNFSFAGFLRFWRQPYEGLYIPLTYTVWAMLVKLSALVPAHSGGLFNPLVFHSANLFVHAANAVVLYCLLRVLVKNNWAALGGALLFALHPLQVESVAWVTGFKSVLCGFFSLLTVWLYAVHTTDCLGSAAWRRFGSPWYAAATVCFLAAMLTMPSAVVVPVLSGIIAVLLMDRPWRQAASELIPWLILAVPMVLLTKVSQPDSQQVFLPSIGQRFLVAGDALSFYLGKFVFPFKLGPDYGRTPEFVLNNALWPYLTGLLPYLLVAIALWRCRNVWVLAAAVIFVAVLSPVLGFVSFTFQDMSTVADRYCYLALVGPAILCAWALDRWPHWKVGGIFGFIVLALAVLSSVQTQHWRDSITFNTYTLSINPRSWLAFHNLGLWYFDNGQMDKAIEQYDMALALKPNSFKAYNNLGMIYDRLGQKEKAIASYKKALEIKPNYPLVNNNIAVIYKGLEQYDEAIAYYQRALALDPEFAEVYANLANLYRVLGRFEEAAANYRKALALRPNNAELANDIGLFFAESNKFEEAIDYYRKAVAVRSGFAEAYANMGVAYKILGRISEAIVSFRQALTHDPGLGDAYVNLGYLLAGEGQHDEAITMYRRAEALDPENEIPHYALGVLYVELGQDSEALSSLQRSVSINPEFGPGYIALSRLFFRAKDYERAIEFVDRAVTLGYVDQVQLDALVPYRKR